ncbi:hypothetical protein D3C85_1737790 [compost metagenome]
MIVNIMPLAPFEAQTAQAGIIECVKCRISSDKNTLAHSPGIYKAIDYGLRVNCQ